MKRKLTLFILLLCFLQWGLLQAILPYNPGVVETIYSNGVYPLISETLRAVFGFINISIGDLGYILLLAYLLYCIYLYTIKKRISSKKFITRIIEILGIVYLLFYSLWGYNYYREPIEKTIEIESDKYTYEELRTFTIEIIKKTNELQIQLSQGDKSNAIEIPYSTKDIFKLAPLGYAEIEKSLPFLAYKNPSIKPSIFSYILTHMGFSGYLNPFSNEAQINIKTPKIGIPITTSHEIAHQIGYASEKEANFIGYLASSRNPDLYFQFSANFMVMRYCLSNVYKNYPEDFNELNQLLNQGVCLTIENQNAFWEKYNSFAQPYIKAGYHKYLKFNNQKKGIHSYNYFLGLVINYEQKLKLMYK